jgi:hypothetical protein
MYGGYPTLLFFMRIMHTNDKYYCVGCLEDEEEFLGMLAQLPWKYECIQNIPNIVG